MNAPLIRKMVSFIKTKLAKLYPAPPASHHAMAYIPVRRAEQSVSLRRRRY
ncbi:MAG: hypothetical protein ACR2PT_18690 [Endozoicomonas sp.]